jgi:predicted glycoside hydrolase/deacetylase ChbG (UPF0249 family)
MDDARLIVAADDLGLTEGINDGIFEAHDHGIVTAAALMPTGTAFADAVTRAAARPALDLGVHLTLDEEASLLEGASTITDRHGRFLSRRELVSRLVRGKVDLGEVERCWTVQLDRVAEAGVVPSFVNSHGHIHAFPTLLPIALRLAERYGIHAIRRPFERPRVSTGVTVARVALVSAAAGWSFRRARNTGVRWPDRFVGLAGSGHLDRRDLDGLLHGASGVVELMTHPGRADEETCRRYGHWGYDWERELAALTSADRTQTRLTTFVAEFARP